MVERDEERNELRRTRAAAKDAEAARRDRPRARSGRDAAENTLAPTPRRERAAEPSAAARTERVRDVGPAAATAADRPGASAVPDEVRRRFREKRGTYYFPDGAPAFTDRGKRLTTPSENTEVVRSLVQIASARGWQDVTVSGSERFRREAWVAARSAGLTVRGYEPTVDDERRVAQRPLARDARDREDDPVARRGARDASVSARSGTMLTGRLLEHGAAPYQNDARRARSYYVKLATPEGERTVWGVDLERALKESLSRPQIGDRVGLRAVKREAVTVREPERDGEGRVVGSREKGAQRTRWIVESREFLAERAAAARVVRDASIAPKVAVAAHPELLGTYLQVKAAELAAKRLRDAADRVAFVARVRASLADAVERGEPLAPVRLKERARTRPEAVREPPARGAARG